LKLKIRDYFNTYSITMGFLIAFLGSAFIYMQWFGLDSIILQNISALLFFWLILNQNNSTWFWSGFFISIGWFWWINVSFIYYQMAWAIPISALLIALVFGTLFWIIGALSNRFNKPFNYLVQVLSLVLFSYLHPFGFDWFVPEAMFTHTYIGVQKWQFLIVLGTIALMKWTKSVIYLPLILFAYAPYHTSIWTPSPSDDILLAGTQIPIAEKWDPAFIPQHITEVLESIQQAADANKSMIVLPESVIPLFLNKQPELLSEINNLSKDITIIIGSLYLEGNTHRNSTYIFQEGNYTVAHKVLLVPFGEGNPLPEWAGKWVNQIFFDGAQDYIASSNITDYKVGSMVYRNAICYEATSDKLYSGSPQNMIAISNNAWFHPSIEPTLQQILLKFYSRKYGTTIYHSINMSPSYIVRTK